MSRRDVLQIVAIFVLVVAGFVVPAYTLIRLNAVQLDVACVNVRTNAVTLQAIHANGVVIRRTARSLGLPVVFPPLVMVPLVPEECK